MKTGSIHNCYTGHWEEVGGKGYLIIMISLGQVAGKTTGSQGVTLCT